MTRPATAAELKYLGQRATLAFRAVQAAKGARLGATVIKRRETAWKVAVAKLEAAKAVREFLAMTQALRGEVEAKRAGRVG